MRRWRLKLPAALGAALAILGVASLIAAHASIIAPQRRTAAR